MSKVTKTSILIDELSIRVTKLESKNDRLSQCHDESILQIRRLEQQLHHMHLLDARLKEFMQMVARLNNPPK